MKSCVELTLLLLGLLLKASSSGNTTKVYFVALQIESSAYDRFIGLLSDIHNLPVNDSVLKSIQITTECDLDKGNCSCTGNNSWIDEVCQNDSSCCNQNSCTFKTPNPTAMCLSVSRVLISGSMTVNVSFSNDYYEQTNSAYGNHITNYTQQLESSFSSLEWFDSVIVTGFRQGSVIVDFLVKIMGAVEMTALENVVSDAAYTLNGTFNLITTGLIKICINQSIEPIPNGSPVSITCQPPEALGKGSWTFQQNGNQAVVITNGTEATVIQDSLNSTVSINSVSDIWKGAFTCLYNSKNSTSIIHTASVILDVALLPQITIISSPPCPICIGAVSPVPVTVQCIIFNQTEEYNVTWISAIPNNPSGTNIQNNQISYKATAIVFCDQYLQAINVTCIFQNRRNQIQQNSIIIPVIYDNSDVCAADGNWPKVKADFTATMLCDGTSVGVRTRTCVSKDSWNNETQLCVDVDLHGVLSDAQNLQRGQGIVETTAHDIFKHLRESTEKPIFNTHANIQTSVMVLETMTKASACQDSKWNTTVFPDIVKSSSNLLNKSLLQYWKNNATSFTLATNFLSSFEGVIKQSNINLSAMNNLFLQQENVQIVICNNQSNSSSPCATAFNASIVETSSTVIQTGMKNLNNSLPPDINDMKASTNIILSVIPVNGGNTTTKMSFQVQRLRNYRMFCAYLDERTSKWSEDGCKWGGANDPSVCHCTHNSAFTILMSAAPIVLDYEKELTYAGLGFSISSLTLCLIIECLVWKTVVKSSISHFRHTVLVNIMLSLLTAHCCFLAASFKPKDWCLVLTVMQHFCLLSMFFWTLCLSMGLLHQLIFVFVTLRKKVYLGLSFCLGYVCPFIIVTFTIISCEIGASGSYYDDNTCWLIYHSVLKGSVYAFIIPVGIIVIVNMFTMVVVISRILKPTVSEGKTHDEKEVARSIVKTVVFLTPTLGITWILGLFVLVLDLTTSPLAQIVNYGFIIFNSFQGFFILLTGCLGEKRVRDALLSYFKQEQSAQYKSESSTRISATKKK